jgi:NADPH:quinone reductase
MRAIVVNQTGGPEVLVHAEEHPDPEPGPGQVVVEAAAAGVNFIDIYRRSGVYKQPLPYVPGSEGAGTVVAVGEGVTVAVGDRVAWHDAAGSYAERVVVDAAMTVPVPDGTDLTAAAAVMLQGMTAHYLCRSTFEVKQGTVAVVHAAAGGVGLLLTQMIKTLGGTVIATTSGGPKAGLAEQAGADYVTGYGEFGAVVDRVTDGRGADVVYDGVGKDTFDASLGALRPRGLMALFGGSSGQVPPFDPQRLNSGGSLFLTRPTLADYTADRAELLWRAGDVLGAVARGELNVRIGLEYSLAHAPRAHEDLAARRTTGKLILIP